MKAPSIKRNRSTVNGGYTLLELTVVMIVAIIIAVMGLTMFNSQLAVYSIINTQNFMIQEAPQIHNSLNRVITRANFFRLYPTLADAQAGQNATITDSTVLALQFKGTGAQLDSFGAIVFDSTNNRLDYYQLPSLAALATATPSWNISTQVNNAVFFVQDGVLRTRITGPNGEEITHSTTTQR